MSNSSAMTETAEKTKLTPFKLSKDAVRLVFMPMARNKVMLRFENLEDSKAVDIDID